MANWYKIPNHTRMTAREYLANVEGINIVFGAVLGFVLVGSETLPVFDFGALLIMSASIVVLILYLGSSEYKLFYALATGAAIIALPYVAEDLFSLTKVPKLQPTLAIWALMILGVEMLPHDDPHKETPKENTQ